MRLFFFFTYAKANKRIEILRWRGQLRSEKVTADFLALECAKGKTPTKGRE